MPFKPGVSGNPAGSANSKIRIFDQTIRRIIAQEDAKRIRQGCEAVMDAFAAGEEWAVKFLSERLDGKMPQPTEVSGPEGAPIEIATRPSLTKEEWLAAHAVGAATGAAE